MTELCYRLADDSDIAAVLQFALEHFVTTEPAHVTLGLSAEEAKPFYEMFLRPSKEKPPVSYIALNEQNEIIACRMSVLVSPEELQEELPLELVPAKAHGFLGLVGRLEKDLPAMLGDCKMVLHYHFLCVRTDYRRQGIAQKLLFLRYSFFLNSLTAYFSMMSNRTILQ